MYTRKRLPRTQYEISTGEKRKTYLRENDIRRDNDKLKQFTTGIFDLDFAVKYYFDNVIRPEIDDGTSKIKVPVIYGSPEKWKNIQADGYIRDKNGKIQVPIISYKRNSIEKDRTLSSKVDPNYPQIYYNQAVVYNKENKYDQFSVLTNTKPIKQYTNIIIPDFVNISYDVLIWTDYVEHMNKIVESILYTEGGYWGEEERFKFRAKIDSFANTTDLLQDSDRIIRTTFTLTLAGQIFTDNLPRELSYKQADKTFDTRQVTTEVDVDPDPELFKTTEASTVGPSPTMTTPIITTPPAPASVDPAVIIYLGKTKSVQATIITIPNIATFTGESFAPAPTPLPATSATDFSFFINGQYVEPSAITSFVESSGNCVLTLNVANLGFTLVSTDEIVAVGRFL
jgi:hypothetical protein